LDKKLWRVILYAAMPLLVLNNGCARSKNQEMAQGFMALAIALRLDQTRQTEIKNLQPPIGCQAQIPGFKSRWITPRSWAAANP
jgi:hypothetical protein